ncbi:MAG: hypothetical protein ACTSXX_13370 [Candidatus Baldrarchaeia archaeon]
MHETTNIAIEIRKRTWRAREFLLEEVAKKLSEEYAGAIESMGFKVIEIKKIESDEFIIYAIIFEKDGKKYVCYLNEEQYFDPAVYEYHDDF